jgi:hypothetical protein
LAPLFKFRWQQQQQQQQVRAHRCIAMNVTRDQKRSAVDSESPLEQAGILQRVLNYVGPGHWWFVAAVNELWKERYTTVAGLEVLLANTERKIVYVPQTTMFNSVLASPARLRHAQTAFKLHCKPLQYKRAAGMYADIATLEAAHALGMQYTHTVMEGAASGNELAVVQFLRSQSCPWSTVVFNQAAQRGHTEICAYLHSEQCPWSSTTCTLAAACGHTSTLRWLREHGCPWQIEDVCLFTAAGDSVDVMVYLQQQGVLTDAALLTRMLNIAGAHNKLAAAKWLRDQGAAWPAALRWQPKQWSGETLTWARAEGCTSPTTA